jgi:hypothetical protein
VLPGFIQMGMRNMNRMGRLSAYLREIRGLVESGFTTMLDTIRIDEWMDAEQIHYQITPHYNNLIDYAIQISLDARQFTPSHLRLLGRQGIRLIQVNIQDPDEMNSFQWNQLYPIIHHYQLSLQLVIPQASAVSRERRCQITKLWLQECQYWKIRTRIEEANPLALIQKEPFYHLALLPGDQCEKWFAYLCKYWYDALPVMSSLEQITVHGKKWRNNPEELLCLLVRLCSANVAKALGVYPRKGCLQAGADADLLFIEKSAWLTNFDLSTILNCSEICLPSYVMSKGKWIYRDGVHSPLVGTGSYLQELTPYSYVI